MSLLTDGQEMIIIGLAMSLEVRTKVEKRTGQGALNAQQKSDQQASDATIAVQERVDRFELVMDHRKTYEYREIGPVMQESLKCAKGFIHLHRWRGMKEGGGA